MVDWIKTVFDEFRWGMVIWVIAVTVGVWGAGAPAWAALIFGIWLLYKENE